MSLEKKLLALSFDDGPDNELTSLVLDKLEKHHVPASFFLIGQLVNDSTKKTLQRMIALSCELNNHSWAWDSMNRMAANEIKKSINNTSDTIKKITGKTPLFFRAPNLAVSDVLYENVDLPFIGGVLAKDWTDCNTSAEERAKNVLSSVRDGAIILLHDVQQKPHPTPEALDIIIPELKKQGYEFVTIGELFKQKKIIPALHESKIWTFVE